MMAQAQQVQEPRREVRLRRFFDFADGGCGPAWQLTGFHILPEDIDLDLEADCCWETDEEGVHYVIFDTYTNTIAGRM